MSVLHDKIRETINNLHKILEDEDLAGLIYRTADVIADAFKSGHKLMICGNGGSAADAQHMTGELICKFYRDRDPLPAVALSTDTSILTSISNDYSYNVVFSRQVKALGRNGDVLLGISTSGKSANVLEAFKVAEKLGATRVLLTGCIEGEIAVYSDIVIKAPSGDTPRIQEMHLVIEHVLCELIESRIYG